MIDGLLILLTFLSALALIVLLAALALALYRIQASLDTINVNAAKILWGVRAIEHETTPLKTGLPELRATLTDVVSGAAVIAATLTQADQHLGAAAEALAGPRRQA
ncbi:MAG: hypothetical protein NVSMB2_11180 [Chloroflexota bacterium]